MQVRFGAFIPLMAVAGVAVAHPVGAQDLGAGQVDVSAIPGGGVFFVEDGTRPSSRPTSGAASPLLRAMGGSAATIESWSSSPRMIRRGLFGRDTRYGHRVYGGIGLSVAR